MSWLKNLHLTIFLIFFRFCQNAWSYEMNIAKATAGLMMVYLWLLIGVIAWAYHLTGAKLFVAIPKPVFFITGLIIAILNYYFLVLRGRGIAFQREFETYPSRRKTLLIAAGLGVIVFSVGFALFSASYAHSHRSRLGGTERSQSARL